MDAIVAAAPRASIVFLLTCDDYVVTREVEHSPAGAQLALGPRVPLICWASGAAGGRRPVVLAT